MKILNIFPVSKRDNVHRYYILKLFGFAVFFHHMVKDEDEGIFHSHPWNGISIILGSYIEQRFGCPKKCKTLLNFVRAKTFHRVELRNGPVWSIFIHFRRSNVWAVKDSTGTILETEPWEGIGGKTSYGPVATQRL